MSNSNTVKCVAIENPSLTDGSEISDEGQSSLDCFTGILDDRPCQDGSLVIESECNTSEIGSDSTAIVRIHDQLPALSLESTDPAHSRHREPDDSYQSTVNFYYPQNEEDCHQPSRSVYHVQPEMDKKAQREALRQVPRALREKRLVMFNAMDSSSSESCNNSHLGFSCSDSELAQNLCDMKTALDNIPSKPSISKSANSSKASTLRSRKKTKVGKGDADKGKEIIVDLVDKLNEDFLTPDIQGIQESLLDKSSFIRILNNASADGIENAKNKVGHIHDIYSGNMSLKKLYYQAKSDERYDKTKHEAILDARVKGYTARANVQRLPPPRPVEQLRFGNPTWKKSLEYRWLRWCRQLVSFTKDISSLVKLHFILFVALQLVLIFTGFSLIGKPMPASVIESNVSSDEWYLTVRQSTIAMWATPVVIIYVALLCNLCYAQYNYGSWGVQQWLIHCSKLMDVDPNLTASVARSLLCTNTPTAKFAGNSCKMFTQRHMTGAEDVDLYDQTVKTLALVDDMIMPDFRNRVSLLRIALILGCWSLFVVTPESLYHLIWNLDLVMINIVRLLCRSMMLIFQAPISQ